MHTKAGTYSGYIRPFSYVADIVILCLFGINFIIFPDYQIQLYLTLSFCWIVIALHLGFYEVYRYTKVISILNCSAKQFLLFGVACLALVYLFTETTSYMTVFCYMASVFFTVISLKLFIFYFLKEYRLLFGGNLRSVVLIGNAKKVAPLHSFFTENLEYGYKVCQSFSLEKNNDLQLQEALDYVSIHDTDEIYCAMCDLNETQMERLVNFANTHFKTLKFIPDESQILSGNFAFQYYGYLPILALRDIRLDEKNNQIAKRFFDIVFSLLVLVFILSWLTPLLALLIILESPGPVFYKHKRNGLGKHVFECYKFRSMQLVEQDAYNPVSKNDVRITKVGKFLRKTSLDELPQFYNVLRGDMSVVGPRPHMLLYTEQYALKVNNFMIRHFIKPGITGLAQTRGYRGAVEKDSDIINRYKYDIFYMENWSILLDIEIILTTIFNIIKGDDKAY
ncbi:exopolysaccharide biosynthesis polyprenyl glycosylphosphotransferase [Flavobacterium agrisoli]|uniref:Exopolysaccharide biosynthesis polyprenyl glycosylphosphotransferase n=1 Tax=Flavobacterium agrisoli TaxID=2793066 RepID=A0A934UJN8_9FLAO|nr:exopolysaccharide biosynthesis polyprenyl glycosylphosphotransferase [Flavobacterium agrisoli]MBK0369615.1 exopolysaccharide biosynthesis polyprenyl glycosylphosphotransferase [Flavobacterium agrisoli]